MRVVIFQKRSILDALKVSDVLSLEEYEPVYIYKPKAECGNIEIEILERVFEDGNLRLPLKYSMSVGDIVAFFKRGKIVRAYVCMPIGWKEVRVKV